MDENAIAILEILKRLELQFNELKTDIKTDMADHTKESADTVRALWIAIDNMKEDRRTVEKENTIDLTEIKTEMRTVKWIGRSASGVAIAAIVTSIIQFVM